MRRRRIAVVAIAGVLAGAAIYVSVDRREALQPTALDQAIAISDDRGRFESSSAATDSFEAIAMLLLAETQHCARDEEPPTPSCIAVGQGAAIAQSATVLARSCTTEGIAEMRRSQRAHLLAINRPIRTEGDLPAVPRLPRCA